MNFIRPSPWSSASARGQDAWNVVYPIASQA